MRSHSWRNISSGNNQKSKLFRCGTETDNAPDRRRKIQAKLRKMLEKSFAAKALGIRWVRPHQLHLTLLFLGNVFQHQVDDLRRQIGQVVKGVPRLPSLKLRGFGCFHAVRHPRVIWFGAAPNCDFDVLQSAMLDRFSRQLSLDNRDRSYPHLTLARSSGKYLPADLPATLANLTKMENAPPLIWEVRSVELMQSVPGPQGSEYTCLAQFFGS